MEKENSNNPRSERHIAEKSGIKTGDEIIKPGNYSFTDVTSYMGALNMFDKGDSTKLTLIRDGNELAFNVIF